MSRFVVASILMVQLAVASSAAFYRPAEYRWYLQTVDFSAGMLSSQPVCQVIGKGVAFPVVLTEKMFAAPKCKLPETRIEMIFRRGMAGEVCATAAFQPGEAWKLPYLPAGLYGVLVKCFAADGTMVLSRNWSLNILEDTVAAASARTAGIDKNIFNVSVRDGKLMVGGLPPKQAGCKLHLIARDRFGEKAFEQVLPCPAGKDSAEFELAAIKPGQMFYLTVELSSPERLLNNASALYFKPGTYPEKKPDWRAIAVPPPVFGEFVVHENQAMKGKFERNLPGLNALTAGMKARGANMINLNFNWSHIEPVSGVFDWSEVDKYVEYFSRQGIAFGFIGCGSIFDSSPCDIWGEWMMDSTGECQLWRNFCVTSPASPKFKTAARDFVRAFYRRYGDNPCFRSWTFSGQGFDSGIFMDHFDRVTDYSPWARQMLTAYLKEKYRTVEELNRAWQSEFKSWADVMPPLPDWSRPVDISRPWLDFNAGKLKIYAEADVRLFDPVVRELDKKNKLSHYLTYTGPIEYLFAEMLASGSHLNDGGGEAHQMVRLYSLAANWELRRQPESHYVPADKRLQLQDMITNTLRYGFSGYDLGTVWNSQVNIHVERYPKNEKLKESMRFWTAIIPVLRSLERTRPLAPPVGFVLSWDDVFCRTRAWRWYALPGEVLQRAAAAVSLGNVPWLSGITPERVYDRLQMIVCSSDNQVFSPELLDKLERFVKRGGNLVLCGKAGEYTVGSTGKFLWRERFKAPSELKTTGLTEWRLGAGRVIYRAEPETADGKFLVEMMARCGIGRETVSSDSRVQAFLLRDGDDLVLVVSAFNGFDRLRKHSDSSMIPVKITLPSLSAGDWLVGGLYPVSGEVKYPAEKLQKDGMELTIEPSGIIIYRVRKVK